MIDGSRSLAQSHCTEVCATEIWNDDTVESLQSHMILTMSHWSSGLTCLLPATRVTGSNPLGGLMWNRDSPVSLSRYIGDPNVIDHQQGFAPPTVTRPSCRQCHSPTWSHTAFLFQFHARCRSPFWLHNRRNRLLGGNCHYHLYSMMQSSTIKLTQLLLLILIQYTCTLCIGYSVLIHNLDISLEGPTERKIY